MSGSRTHRKFRKFVVFTALAFALGLFLLAFLAFALVGCGGGGGGMSSPTDPGPPPTEPPPPPPTTSSIELMSVSPTCGSEVFPGREVNMAFECVNATAGDAWVSVRFFDEDDSELLSSVGNRRLSAGHRGFCEVDASVTREARPATSVAFEFFLSDEGGFPIPGAGPHRKECAFVWK